MDPIPSIDDMPHLKARLGKAGCDRIRYVGRASEQRQPRSTNIPNTLRETLQDLRATDAGSPVLDILQGAARMDEHSNKPLDVSRMLAVLQCVPIINTREVMKMLDISERVARKYVRALKLAYPLIEKQVDMAA